MKTRPPKPRWDSREIRDAPRKKGKKLEFFPFNRGGWGEQGLLILVIFLFVSESKNAYWRQKRVFGKNKKNNRQ